MRYLSRIKIAALLTVFTLFSVATQVFAAEIFVDSKSQKIKAGEQFEAGIFLDTEEEYINAVEGKIVFPNDLLGLKEIRDGNSVINFWVERPRAVDAGSIDFSGIIPGGYQETKGFLFSVVFQAQSSGSGVIEIRDAKVLLHDGKGTQAEVKISNFQFLISPPLGDLPQGDNQIPKPAIKDIESPETFRPEVARDESLFDGKWFLVFATQDKGSGVDHYEVHEGVWGGFRIAESPYLLQNQKLDKKIFVKAVDKSGNERSEILYPPHWRPWYKNYWILGILIMGAMCIAYIVRKNVWAKCTR